MSSNNKVLNLLSDLVKYESVTPDTSACQTYIDNYLSELGFKTEYIKYGDVQNIISTYGDKSPCLVFRILTIFILRLSSSIKCLTNSTEFFGTQFKTLFFFMDLLWRQEVFFR